MIIACTKCGARHDHRAGHKCQPASRAAEVKAAERTADPPVVLSEARSRAIQDTIEDSLANLRAGEPCPTCGKLYRPRMSDAERARRYRERKRQE